MEKRIKFIKGYQMKLLLSFKKKFKLSERKLSKKFNVSRRTLRAWINENRTLPYKQYLLILKEDKKLKYYNKFVIKLLDKNWGQVLGGKIRFKHLKQTGKFQEHHKLMINNKMNNITSKRIPLPKRSNYFYYLENKKIPFIPLLQTMLFTDGYLNENGGIISFTSKNFRLIEIFNDLISALSKNEPRILLRKNGIYEFYLYDKILIRRLLKLSPTYKTGLNSFPSLKFLFKQKKDTIIECLRLAMSTDGCIILYQENKSPLKIRGRLVLSCINNILVKGWQELFNKIDFKMYIIKKNSKNYIGLGTTKFSLLKKFYYLNGFIEGVKISAKSIRFSGYTKNDLLWVALNSNKFSSWDEIKRELNFFPVGS